MSPESFGSQANFSGYSGCCDLEPVSSGRGRIQTSHNPARVNSGIDQPHTLNRRRSIGRRCGRPERDKIEINTQTPENSAILRGYPEIPSARKPSMIGSVAVVSRVLSCFLASARSVGDAPAARSSKSVNVHSAGPGGGSADARPRAVRRSASDDRNTWFARGTIVIVKISMTTVQAADMAQMAGSNRRGDVGHCSSVTAKK